MKTVSIKTIDGGQATVDPAIIDEFKANFRGTVYLAGDHGYDSFRQIWNGIIDRKPAMIARCVGTSDIVNTVKFAPKANMLLSVKSGGHNSAGTAA